MSPESDESESIRDRCTGCAQHTLEHASKITQIEGSGVDEFSAAENRTMWKDLSKYMELTSESLTQHRYNTFEAAEAIEELLYKHGARGRGDALEKQASMQ